jgi:hypothetical protein
MHFELEQAVAAAASGNSLLKELAAGGQRPPMPLPSLHDIHLFLHDYASAAMLAPLTSLIQLVSRKAYQCLSLISRGQLKSGILWILCDYMSEISSSRRVLFKYF